MFKPMLAATMEDEVQLRYPLLASYKLDGFRCILKDGAARMRSLKPVRNQFIQNELASLWNSDLDGEIIVGSPCDGNVLNRTQSGVTASFEEPDFKLYVFDCARFPDAPYYERLELATELAKHPRVEVLNQTLVNSADELRLFEERALGLGYEGIMARCPKAGYKYGRATPNENALWKIKRFTDGEAVVATVLEGSTNNNPATINARGETERATIQANMIPNKQVGTLVCKDCITGEVYNVAPGRMTVGWRQYYWAHPEDLIGKIVKHKSFDYGSLNTARFKTFQALRDAADM